MAEGKPMTAMNWDNVRAAVMPPPVDPYVQNERAGRDITATEVMARMDAMYQRSVGMTAGRDDRGRFAPRVYSPREQEVTEVPDSLARMDETLADEAAELLGYGVLKNKHVIEDRKVQLYAALRKLGMKILVQKDVDEYKTGVIQRLNAKEDMEFARTNDPYSPSFGRRPPRWRWNGCTLQEYAKLPQEPVPTHLLARAIELKKELPTVEFGVDFLMREARVDPEPFLWAQHGNERVFLGVWNEPDFVEKRVDV